MVEIEAEPRRVNFAKFTDYIQKNYRKNLNERDREILQAIASTYSNNEIKLAIAYCKNNETDSLMYLQKTLKQKYYLSENINIVPEWLNSEIKSEPLTEEDKEWMRNFYKKYCGTAEEYNQRLKENSLEVSKSVT